ncbi:MAG: hypothetical protein CME65_06895 [Halobacteriovoraceae bacterium]|nr:hypothetical protein [Halobacteriovoraceae bacterium]
MRNALQAFKLSYQVILKDKISLLLAMIPILIGLSLYIFAGKAFFTGTTEYGQQLIQSYIDNDSAGKAVGYLLSALVAVLLYFIVNWTFVLVVSILASPFNDLLSSRIERHALGQKPQDIGEAVSNSLKKLLGTVFNEIKKVCFILGLSMLAFLIGLIPFLAPVSFLVGALVIAAEFLDFSWSRLDLPLKECRASLKQNWFGYSLGGAFFLVLIAIPVLGILVPSWGTSFFTILWVKNNEHRYQVTQ